MTVLLLGVRDCTDEVILWASCKQDTGLPSTLPCHYSEELGS